MTIRKYGISHPESIVCRVPQYAEQKPAPPSVFQRFAEGMEDTMRGGKMSASTVAQTMGFLSQAMGVLNGVAAAGKSVAGDLVNAPASPPPASPAPQSPVDPKPEGARHQLPVGAFPK